MTLRTEEQCALCRGDNRCRLAKGELYKGPCWCEEITLPRQILELFSADALEPSCYCRPCLEQIAYVFKQFDDLEQVRSELKNWLSSKESANESS